MGMDLILICFAALACLSSGLVFSASFLQLKGRTETIGALQFGGALLLIIAAGAMGLVSLGRPEMFLGALAHPGTGIFFELIGTLLLCFGAVCWLIAFWRDSSETILKFFAVFAAAGAVCLLFGVGRSFVMPWRETLNSWLVVPLFFIFALEAAAFAYAAAERAIDKEFQSGNPALIFSLVGALCLGGYLMQIMYSSSNDGKEAALSVLTGEPAVVFWCGVVVIGLMVPAVLACRKLGKIPFRNAAGLLAAVIGSASFQTILLVIGTASWQFFKR